VNARVRVALFVVAGLGLVAFLAWGFSGLPSFGHYPGPYGDLVVHHALADRQATNATTTVVMDIRAVDTAGEELILLAAVVGVLMLLRKLRGETDSGDPDVAAPIPASGPVRGVASALVAPTAVLALYIIVHGAITPGGGFQGGVIIAGPSALLFLASRRRPFNRFHHAPTWETAQGVAVTGFLLVGFAGLLASARAFLANFLPKGVAATVYSAGTIPVLNLFAGVAVATAVVLVMVDLLRQVTAVRGE
jgi:multicomponent Na+:H+ antiporter subunit B